MAEFNGPVPARDALMDYIYDREDALEDDVRDGLRQNLKIISPVVCVIECIKLVYDRLPDCPKPLRLWAADAAIMCSNFGFETITVDVAETLRL